MRGAGAICFWHALACRVVMAAGSGSRGQLDKEAARSDICAPTDTDTPNESSPLSDHAPSSRPVQLVCAAAVVPRPYEPMQVGMEPPEARGTCGPLEEEELMRACHAGAVQYAPTAMHVHAPRPRSAPPRAAAAQAQAQGVARPVQMAHRLAMQSPGPGRFLPDSWAGSGPVAARNAVHSGQSSGHTAGGPEPGMHAAGGAGGAAACQAVALAACACASLVKQCSSRGSSPLPLGLAFPPNRAAQPVLVLPSFHQLAPEGPASASSSHCIQQDDWVRPGPGPSMRAPGGLVRSRSDAACAAQLQRHAGVVQGVWGGGGAFPPALMPNAAGSKRPASGPGLMWQEQREGAVASQLSRLRSLSANSRRD